MDGREVWSILIVISKWFFMIIDIIRKHMSNSDIKPGEMVALAVAALPLTIVFKFAIDLHHLILSSAFSFHSLQMLAEAILFAPAVIIFEFHTASDYFILFIVSFKRPIRQS